MKNKKYKFAVDMYCGDINGEFNLANEPDCNFEVESDTLDAKPTSKDILAAAAKSKCADLLYVVTSVTEDGNYFDSDEALIELDYENQTIKVA